MGGWEWGPGTGDARAALLACPMGTYFMGLAGGRGQGLLLGLNTSPRQKQGLSHRTVGTAGTAPGHLEWVCGRGLHNGLPNEETLA